MPKFKIKAYEEVYYSAEIEANDRDEAEELFYDQLGEYHPFQTNHNFTMLEVKRIAQPKKKELNHA